MTVGPWSRTLPGALLLAIGPATALAQTELHFQYGSHTNPFARTSTGTAVFTFQYASAAPWGDDFLFIDVLDDGVNDGFNDIDFYGEVYSNTSLAKLRGEGFERGPVADLGLVVGLAAGADANFFQTLTGARISWRIPGFVFLNTDFMGAIDYSGGLDSGGAPKAGNRFVFDINGLLPFNLGSRSLSITGHAEYASPTTNELGNDVPFSILAQPQLRWDIGKQSGYFVGIEYQYWRNKLGTDVDENIVQLLVVWQY
ncbi:MAG: nucleoside-binding protein [Gemmatimonadetes bacterium]|nr:nucleoside-binding protein [Gemmatimonadota bacterium]